MTAVFAMGGAVGVAGNIAAAGEGIDNSTAGWDFWVDPRAANIVLSSGAPFVLVPLDATRHDPASMEFLDALQPDHTNAASVIDSTTRNKCSPALRGSRNMKPTRNGWRAA